MDTPNYWDIDEKQKGSEAESSAQAEHRLEPAKSLNLHKSKSEVATLENAASKFPSFILPSLQKAHMF